MNPAMRNAIFLLVVATLALTGCKKSSAPAGSAKSGDAVQQKLQEDAGSGATDCGRLNSQAPDQMKTASDCAMQAAKSKHPFYVAYDLPGMTVAVAGNAEGKLFSVNSQKPENEQGGATEVKSEPCPAELRIAQSGRVTCFPLGSFGGAMGASPHGGAMGMPPATGENPHGSMAVPPAGTPNPHAKPGPNH